MYDQLEYSVRRSDRARRVRVTVDPRDGIEVVLPRRAPARAAAAAVAELRPWIERRLAEADALREQIGAGGNIVPFLGAERPLVVQPGPPRVTRRGAKCFFRAGA